MAEQAMPRVQVFISYSREEDSDLLLACLTYSHTTESTNGWTRTILSPAPRTGRRR